MVSKDRQAYVDLLYEMFQSLNVFRNNIQYTLYVKMWAKNYGEQPDILRK